MLLGLYDRKHAGDIKAKTQAGEPAILIVFKEPVFLRFRNEAFVAHVGRIGEMKLENVSAGFDVEPE